jgi:general secretion pathway protein F
VNNLPIRKAIQNSILRVKEGTPISQALKTTTYFSPISLHLIASGEMSGRLEMMLQRAATHEENAVTRLFETGLSLFEPLLILLMGSVVLFIVLAVLLPIFSLYQFVGQ